MRRGKRGNSRWERKREGDAKMESRGGTWRAMGRAEIEWIEWVEREIGRIEREIGRAEWVAMAALNAFEGFRPLFAAVAVP